MSEAEEFSRMSELAEVSDEEDYESSYDDIPEEPGELETSQDEAWPEVQFERNGPEYQETAAESTPSKGKSKPYVVLCVLKWGLSQTRPFVF